jgi:4-hydroxybenzoate polyprenyltransferase
MPTGHRAWVGVIRSSHLGPCLVLTAIAVTLAWRAGAGSDPGRLSLFAVGVLAGELSIGWSNDYADADRDARADRRDKPIVAGTVSRRAVAACAGIALGASVLLCFLVSPATGVINLAMMVAGWAYNLALKATLASGLAYVVGFGLAPALAASAGPGGPPAPAWMLGAAALLGLGGHFANVLPDLEGDRVAGVGGLPQRVAAAPGGPVVVRAIALVLLLGATALIAVAAGSDLRTRPLILTGLVVAGLLGVLGAVARGRVPFYAALGIAGLDTVLLLVMA